MKRASATIYFRATDLDDPDVFSPEIHEWLAFRDGLYLFPLKITDTWTAPPRDLKTYKQTSSEEVPSHVRRKTGQRYGAWKRKKGPK